MSAVSGVNLAMLPADESEFLDWLSTTGDIWATYYLDESGRCQYEPMPAKQFRQRFSKEITRYDEVHMYLGHREDVLNPRIQQVTVCSVIPHESRFEIDRETSQLICYRHGLVNSEGILNRTSVCYYTSFSKDGTWVKKSPDWIKWARKVVGWLKRRATEKVPIYRCNYSIPATPLVCDAVATGLKVV
jgi:hypothetical protein